MYPVRPRIVAAALVCALGGIPEGSAGESAPSPRPSLPAQERLRQCVALEIEQQDFKVRMNEADQALDQARAERRAYNDQVDRQRRSLDNTDADAVRAFNAMLDRDDALVEVQNARNADFNALVDQHNDAVERYNDLCPGLEVSPEARYAERKRQLKARGD